MGEREGRHYEHLVYRLSLEDVALFNHLNQLRYVKFSIILPSGAIYDNQPWYYAPMAFV
jgi:hypothetical protein